MTRSRWFLAAAALATAAVGCAHCDTCDDFPVPCAAEGGCGDVVAPMPLPMLDPMMGAPVMMGAPGTMMVAPAPIVTSQPAPAPAPAGAAPGAAAPNGGSGPLIPPPLPGGSETQPFSPPAPSARR